jgi:hypothetical protein
MIVRHLTTATAKPKSDHAVAGAPAFQAVQTDEEGAAVE